MFVRAVYIVAIIVGQCVTASADLQPLKFCMYLEVNNKFIYPFRLLPEKVTRHPFMMEIIVRGHTNQSLETILRDFLTKNLGVKSIEHIYCNLVHFDQDMGMIHTVQSTGGSSLASPVEMHNSRHAFENVGSLLKCQGDALRSMIAGKNLRVSIQSNTDSINTIGVRLHKQELQEQGKV